MSSRVRLVVCINERLGSGQRSCVGSGNLGYISDIEQMIKAVGLEVKIVKRECLGRCAEGPIMRIAPGGRLFTEVDQSSLASIIDELKTLVD
jgi:(2Fe-2S) ferredoxin